MKNLLRTTLIVAAFLIITGPVAAQSLRPGYRVSTWGYYDRYPYAPVGPSFGYMSGPPVVSYVDPWGRVVDMPLRPKVLYGNTPILVPGGGYHYPTSISVTRGYGPPPLPPMVTVAKPAPEPVLPGKIEVAKPDAEPLPLIPKARDLDAAEVPEPPPVPKVPAPSELPPVPKLPALPKPPPVPGVPNLGPAPSKLPPPPLKDR